MMCKFLHITESTVTNSVSALCWGQHKDLESEQTHVKLKSRPYFESYSPTATCYCVNALHQFANSKELKTDA